MRHPSARANSSKGSCRIILRVGVNSRGPRHSEASECSLRSYTFLSRGNFHDNPGIHRIVDPSCIDAAGDPRVYRGKQYFADRRSGMPWTGK